MEEADCSSGAKPAGKRFDALHGRYGSASCQKIPETSLNEWGGGTRKGYSTFFFFLDVFHNILGLHLLDAAS